MIDHPSDYLERRAVISALSTFGRSAPTRIEYEPQENSTWRRVAESLRPLWEQHVCDEAAAGWEQLGLPTAYVPQLADVNDSLAEVTGVTYAAVDGILPALDFFGFLARSMFPSTQYVRWSGEPDYTPEPDIIHEVLGHASMLADPLLAELHRRAGCAGQRIASPASMPVLADVFWFTVEFGVVRDSTPSDPAGVRAYGAGLLSSPGELATFHERACIRPLDIAEMCATPYRTDRHQPVLFAADSLDQVVDVVGDFFDTLE